jgi:hypothetical protein
VEGLLKRISAEGSEAENALRVIAFFDELVGNHSPLDALVRSTARLIGAPAGFESRCGGSSWSFDAIGRPYVNSVPTGARSERIFVERGFSGVAWILPETSNYALADLVLERMALSAAIVLGRDTGEGALAAETSLSRLLDRRNSDDDRKLDAQLLGFRSNWVVRVVAAKPQDAATTDVITQLSAFSRSVGARATAPIVDGDLYIAMLHDNGQFSFDGFAPNRCQIAIGSSESVENAYLSLECARLALRLCSAEIGPNRVDYATLGPLRFVAAVPPSEAGHDETVRQLSALLETETGRAELLALDAFCRHTSLRNAAAELNLHHSSLAYRLDNVARKLDREVSDPTERFSLALSLQLLRVARSG